MNDTDHILVIESPSLHDLSSGRHETAVVTAVLDVLDVPHIARTVHSKAELQHALRLFANGKFRAIHLSAHGVGEGGGIALTNDEIVSWDDLFSYLDNGPQASVLMLSSCAAHANNKLAQAMLRSKRRLLTIGPRTSVTWSSSAIAVASMLRTLHF